MSIGERIIQGRYMAGLSQAELAEKVKVSAQAISKYERNLDVPSSGVLLRLSKALDLRVEFFLRPQHVSKISPVYRKKNTLPRKQEDSLLAKIRDWLERYLEIESLCSLQEPGFISPKGFPHKIRSIEQVEQVALKLRESWELGLDPIENMTELLEDKGIKVGDVKAGDDFDACTFQAETDGLIPVIVTRHGLPGDRQRFNLAHELGHLMLEIPGDVNSERVAHRFAGAFLVPDLAARFELGESRHKLDTYELHLLKHKHGLSMQGWIYRAKDLGILSESVATELFKEFRRKGWHKEEPGDPYPAEQPKRLHRLVMQTLAEGVISETRAAELLGMPLPEFWERVAEEHGGLTVGVRH